MKSLLVIWLVSRHHANKINALELLKLIENKIKARSDHFFTADDRIFSVNFLVFQTIHSRTPLTELIGTASHMEKQKIRIFF
jgi:hypothetical protein